MSESSNSGGAAPAAPAPASGEGAGPQPLGQSPRLQGGISPEEAVKRLTAQRAEQQGKPPPTPRRDRPADAAPAAAASEGADPIDQLIQAFRGGKTDAPAQAAAEPAPANGHDPSPDAPIRLTIDGKPQDFTVAQLINHVRMAADYTQKTQQLTALHKQVNERAQAIDRMLPVLVPEIERQIAALDAQLGQPIDWDTLSRTDPAEYIRQDAAWKRAQAERQRLQDLTAMQQQETEQQQAQRSAAGHAKLVEQLPGWDNPQTRARLTSEIRRWGREAGFSDGQLNAVHDPAEVVTLFKAMAFDRMMNNVKTSAPVVPVVQRRGTPPQPRQREAMNDAEARFQQTHSMRDAIAALNAKRRSMN